MTLNLPAKTADSDLGMGLVTVLISLSSEKVSIKSVSLGGDSGSGGVEETLLPPRDSRSFRLSWRRCSIIASSSSSDTASSTSLKK